jgi:carbon starvation protein
VSAFVDGAANFLLALGVSPGIAVALMGVLVASFAGTTLDTACRLQRYVVQELAGALAEGSISTSSRRPWQRILANKHGATVFAVLIAAVLAAVPPSGAGWSFEQAGKGGLMLWPLFGATNQLLGGLAFLVIAFYLWRRRRPMWFLILPMVFMLIMPFWAMAWQVFLGSGDSPSWISQGRWTLVGIGLVTMALEVWMIIEACILFPRVRGVLECETADLRAPRLSATSGSAWNV